MNKIKVIITLIMIITLSLSLFINCDGGNITPDSGDSGDNGGDGGDGEPEGIEIVEVVDRWDYYFNNSTHDDDYSVTVAYIWDISYDDNGNLITAGKYIPNPESYDTRLDSIPCIWRETGTDDNGNTTVQKIDLPRNSEFTDPETELKHAEFRGSVIHAIAFKDFNDIGHYYYFNGSDNTYTDVLSDGTDTYNEIDYMEKIDGEIYIAATNKNTDNPEEPYYDRLAVFKVTDTGLEKQGNIVLPTGTVHITSIQDIYIDSNNVIYLASNYQEGRLETRTVYAGWHKNDGSPFTKVGDVNGVSDYQGQYVFSMVSPDDYMVYNDTAGEIEIIIDGGELPYALQLGPGGDYEISDFEGMVEIGGMIYLLGVQKKERADYPGSYIDYPTVWKETGAIDMMVDYDDIGSDFEDILDSNFYITPFADESGYAVNLNKLYKENKYRVTAYIKRTFATE